MDLDTNTDTKQHREIHIDLTPRLDYPLDPNLGLAPPADPPLAEFTIKLSPPDMEFVSIAPVVLGEPGLLWFDVRTDGVTMSAAGKHIAFSHDTRIHAPIPASSFGVSAQALASAVRHSRQFFPRNPLVITVNPGTGNVFVKPDAAALTGGVPLEALLIDLSGNASPDHENIEEQTRVAERRHLIWRLSGYFDQPEAPSQPVDPNQAPVSFDPRTLQRCLADAGKLVPRAKSKLGVLQLGDGRLYGGDEDVLFWYDVPSLANCSCVIARQQIAPLEDLLALLPSSERCEFLQAGSAHIIRNERTTISLLTCSDPHPAPMAAIAAKLPATALQLNAQVFRGELNGLGSGEADNGDFVFFHGTLLLGRPAVLQTESLSPRTGGQFTRGADLHVAPGQALEAADFVASLRAMQRATARLSDDITLRVTTKALYIDGVVKGMHPIKRTAKLWAETAEPPAQLRRQVRRLARTFNV